ncbi:ATP-binding protein [Serratia marcescens]|uniref:ATP-binding protein n=1 Tax=Serratia marcescens TaxID=615 RepID=UPI003FA74180
MVPISPVTDDVPVTDTDNEELYDFLAAVAQIEWLLQQACHARQREGEADPVSALLAQEPGGEAPLAPRWACRYANWAERIPAFDMAATGRMARLVQRFGLTDFELAVIILGCLCRFEPHYGKVLSLLQSGGHTQPGAEFALWLCCPGQFLRNAQRACFLADAPLVRYGLLEWLVGYKEERLYQTSEMIYHWLLGFDSLPAALQDRMAWLPANDDRELVLETTALLHCWHQERDCFPALLELRVAAGMSGEQAAALVARRMGMRALLLKPEVLDNATERTALLNQAIGAALLYSALLVLPEIPPRSSEESSSPTWACLGPLLATHPLPVCALVSSSSPITPLPQLSRWVVPVTMPVAAQRLTFLQQRLDAYPHAPMDLHPLVQRVVLPPAEFASAVLEAALLQRQRGGSQIEQCDLQQALVRRGRQNFTHLAQRISPLRTLEDVVIGDDLQAQLAEILCAIRQRENTLAQGFARKLGGEMGISALFHGDPGTGKTLVAEALANQLGVDLIRVNLSTVINKYIGETEKNLAQIFDLAAHDAGLLFFDEADALFGKRSEVKDAKDRHANIEIAYLLQRFEQHPGLVVLATNHRSHLDDAFSRRFTFIVRFSYPDAALREKMWRQAWPSGIKLAADLDFAQLAQTPLTGANIRNIALLAAWLAADAGCITSAHIQHALLRELSKIGRRPG